MKSLANVTTGTILKNSANMVLLFDNISEYKYTPDYKQVHIWYLIKFIAAGA